jgi:LPS sulfotransferase NodH
MGLKQVINSYITHPKDIYRNFYFRIGPVPSSKKHIFILGAPRSGTTLLQSILSVHSEVSSFDNETGFFMYRDIFSHQFEGIPTASFQDLSNSSQDIVGLFDAVAQEHLANNKPATIFLEKTPQHVIQLANLVKWFPRSRFINIYRDCRDSAVSALKFSTSIEQGKNMASYLRYWNKCIKSRLLVDSSQIFDLKYEDLVKNPHSSVQGICNHLCLEFDEKLIQPEYFSRNKRAGKKGFEKLSSAIDDKSVGQWKSFFSKDDISALSKQTECHLKILGYE